MAFSLHFMCQFPAMLFALGVQVCFGINPPTSDGLSSREMTQGWCSKPTVRCRDDFDSRPMVEKLYNAMDGFGTNEVEVLYVLGKHCNQQRLEIAEAFKVGYGKELIEDFKSELGGNFETLCISLLIPPRLYDARKLHEAVSGAGTDESVLVEILVTSSKEEIQEIKQLYKEKYERELEEDLQNDTSGNFGRMMVSLCVRGRQSDDWYDGYVNDDMEYKAMQDAQKFQEAGAKSWGTNESEFNVILCLSSPGQLRRTIRKYEELTGQSMEDAIRKECSGPLQEGFLTIVESVKSRSKYFARRLKECFEGLGTQHDRLIRIIVSRSEIDLEAIKKDYQEMYGKTLEESVEDECSGSYKRLLLKIIKPQY